MAVSRTSYAIKNIGAAGIFQVLSLLLSFISRSVFVNLLGNDYLSCEGLFSNILTILSFSELGIGSSIIFSLYKPIVEDDKILIGKLMNLFRKSYFYIALAISIVGLLLIPFLGYIVKDVPEVKESITLLYVLFLANTVASYIFGYKRSFLIACQKNYIVLTIQQVASVLKIVFQISLLLWTHDYVLYLIIAIISTLLSNVISTYVTNKQYPWLNDYLGYKLSKIERKPIFSNIYAIIQYKLGYVFLQGIGNILISVCLVTSLVGKSSNYLMITGAVTSLFFQLYSSIQSTIGNFSATVKKEDNGKLFFVLYFINFWLVGNVTIMMALFITPFISNIWLHEDYGLDRFSMLAICFSFFVLLSNNVPSTFRSAMGFFKQAKYCPIYAAILNVIMGVCFAKWMGLAGIFIAQGVARLLTFSLIDPYFVLKHGLGLSPMMLYKRIFVFGGTLVFVYLASAWFMKFIAISDSNILGLLFNVLICFIFVNILLFLFFSRTKDFQFTFSYLKNHLKR